MRLRKTEILTLAMAALFFIIGIYFHPQMPERVASHWNARGEVDGYMSKFWGLFILPIIIVPITLLFLAIPRMNPSKANIEKFRKYYDGFVILFMLFLLAIYMQVILWNTGTRISPNLVLPIAFGLLQFYLGILCENAKTNRFIGIRTPWTLSNEIVWEKTHRIAGKLFKIAGVLALVGLFFQSLAIVFVIVPALVVSIYAVIYSYFAYQKEMKNS